MTTIGRLEIILTAKALGLPQWRIAEQLGITQSRVSVILKKAKMGGPARPHRARMQDNGPTPCPSYPLHYPLWDVPASELRLWPGVGGYLPLRWPMLCSPEDRGESQEMEDVECGSLSMEA